MRNVFIAWIFFTCITHIGYAGTVGDSHNARNAIGRNRANVMLNPVASNPQTSTPQPVIQDVPTIPAAPETVPDPEPTVAEPVPEIPVDLTPDIAAAAARIAMLQSEIAKIDSEMARCKKAKNNWTIGTVVGAVGVAGTATGAIVQAVKINKAKKNGATTSDNATTSEEAKDE